MFPTKSAAFLSSTLTALLLAGQLTAQQVTVDLDAKTHGGNTPLGVPLPAGCWKITPVAGTYTAWHAWGGTNAGCNAQGLECSQGWATLFYYSWSGGGEYGSTGFYSTETIALANAREAYLSLPQAETVFFGVADQALGDNLGGVSLLLEVQNAGAAASETVRLGTPPNPASLLPGVTSGPIIHSVWDPVIDHTSFAQQAGVDFLAVDLGAPINVPLAIGTLLCTPPPTKQIFFASPGVPFAVSIPNDCNFIGQSACAQGGSFTPGTGLELTNALDLVIGSF